MAMKLDRSEGAAPAFTLIELLIVVAIIAILAAIAVPNFLEAQTRSKVARAQADMRTIATAVESYRVDNATYPPASRRFGTGWIRTSVIARYARLTTPVSYITSIPEDPFFVGAGTLVPTAWGGNVYDYFERDVSPLVTNPWGPGSSLVNSVWFVNSFGPDRLNDGGNRPDGFYNHLVYDPTNGTVSAGDVTRWGPGGTPE
jgi:type II secretion system protein G